VQALLAASNASPADAAEDVLARAASLADRLEDPSLRSYAFAARSHAAFEQLRFEDIGALTERRLELLPLIEDPDHRCEAYESAVPVAATLGRIPEARGLVEQHWEIARRLTPHHRLHAVSLKIELADALGDWHALSADHDLVAQAVEANRDTPCVRNARDLLLLALARLCLGDEQGARELERRADLLAGEGHERALNPPRLRIALVRGDARRARELIGIPMQRTFVWGSSAHTAKLDVLVALREHEEIERDAPALLRPGMLFEPFALRALGAARDDEELLERADERFGALGLDWHRGQTERLLAGIL
jgi:hypothetical protein